MQFLLYLFLSINKFITSKKIYIYKHVCTICILIVSNVSISKLCCLHYIFSLKITRSADKATWFKNIKQKKKNKTACEHTLKVGIRMNFLSFVSKWKQNKAFANHR